VLPWDDSVADKPPPPPKKAPPPPPMKAPPPPPKKAPPPPPMKAPPPPPKKAPPPKPPMSESDIKKAIAKAVGDEDYELAAQLKAQLKASAPPKKAPPPPPKKAPPPPPKKAADTTAKKRPMKDKPKGRPKGKPKGRPKGKPKSGQKKGRRIKINLRLRQSTISDEDDSYTDQVGWTVSHDDYQEPEAPISKEPEAISHQCSFCGAMMRIPKPTRDRYTVICPHPECGHEDKVGF